jgi:hypothetical protein
MDPTIPKPCVWSTAEEIMNHTWSEWIAAHTSFVAPLHHHTGSIHITEQGSIVLQGTSETSHVVIKKSELISVHLGFDEVFKRRYDRDLGLTFTPLSITCMQENQLKTFYLAIELDHLFRTTNNQEWFDAIQALQSQ